MDLAGYVESGKITRLRRLGGVFDLIGYDTISANDLVIEDNLTIDSIDFCKRV